MVNTCIEVYSTTQAWRCKVLEQPMCWPEVRLLERGRHYISTVRLDRCCRKQIILDLVALDRGIIFAWLDPPVPTPLSQILS